MKKALRLCYVQIGTSLQPADCLEDVKTVSLEQSICQHDKLFEQMQSINNGGWQIRFRKKFNAQVPQRFLDNTKRPSKLLQEL